MTKLSKADLQQQLDARGITYNKRLGVAKLQLLLDEAVKPVVRSEDQVQVGKPVENQDGAEATTEQDKIEPSLEVKTDEGQEGNRAGQAHKIEGNAPNATVQAIRQNAKIVKEQYGKIKAKADVARALKLGRRTYIKQKRNNAVEIYEHETSKYIRTYSKDVHGPEYEKLADKFVDGRNNSLQNAPVKIRYVNRPIVI